MILLYDLSPYPLYPEIPWLSVDLMRARGICYLKCKHSKTHTSQNPWCFKPLIHGNQKPERPDQTLMPHSRMLAKWCILGALLHKGWLLSWHIENLLKWLKWTFSNMPDGQYPRNWFDLDLSCDKPYISISPLIVYKNLLFPAMYSRLEQVPTQIKSSLSQWLLSVIRFFKSHPKGVSVNPEKTCFKYYFIESPLELRHAWPCIDLLPPGQICLFYLRISGSSHHPWIWLLRVLSLSVWGVCRALTIESLAFPLLATNSLLTGIWTQQSTGC